MPQFYVYRSNSLQSNYSFEIMGVRSRTIPSDQKEEFETMAPTNVQGNPVIIVNQYEDSSISKRLFDQKCLCAGTTLYACLSALLLICCIIHCLYRLNTFLFHQTTVNVKFDENTTVIPPCVTVCASDLFHNKNPVIWQPFLREAFGNITYKNAYELMKKTDITIDAIWNMSRIAVKNVTREVIQHHILSGHSSYKTIEEEEIFAVNGICTTFKPKQMIPCAGMKSGIVLKSTQFLSPEVGKDITYAIVFHTEEEIPLIRYYGTLGTGMFLPYNEHVNTALRIRHIIHLDSWNDRCNSRDVASLCVARCIDRHILSTSNLSQPCRLPYMEEILTVPACTTADEFMDIYTSTEQVLKGLDINDDCDCPKSCEYVIYTAEYFFREPTADAFHLFLNFPDCQIEIIEEEISYGLTAFLSDVGGSLGLFLGLSLLGLYDITVKLIAKRKEKKSCC